MATPSENSKNLAKTAANEKATSNLVHKPFANGEINFFRPFKGKTSHRYQEEELLIDDDLETDTIPSPQLEQQTSRLFNVWNLSAIAILLLTNFMALGVIRIHDNNSTADAEVQTPTIENSDLAAREFVPLNLSTLSNLSSSEEPNTTKEPDLIPDSLIPPAFAPFNPDTFSNQYHYVLAQYTGDRSLELAREKIPHISLLHLPQGMFIYLGAFAEPEPANAFVNKLEQTGIEARIYPFE